MARVHPLAGPFADLNAAPDGADFDEEAGDGPPSTLGAAPEGNRGMLGRGFPQRLAALGASFRTDVADLERGFSALAHADNNVSFSESLPDEDVHRDGSVCEWGEEDEEATEPSVAEGGPPPTVQPQPTTPHLPCWTRISPARKIAKMRASSAPRRRRTTGERAGLLAALLAALPNATDLRVWLAAYISVADYGSDVYSISVRPIICCCPVGQR